MNINLYFTEKENVVLHYGKTILSNDTIDSLNIENFENCEKEVPIKNIYFVSLLHDLAINDKSFNDSLYHYTKNNNIRLHIFKENSREFFKTLGIVKFDDLTKYGSFHTIDNEFFNNVEEAIEFFSFDDKLNTFNVLKAPVKVVEKRKYIVTPKVAKVAKEKVNVSNLSTNLVLHNFENILSIDNYESYEVGMFDFKKYDKVKNIYLFIDNLNNYYTNKIHQYCLENEINLYTVLPIKSNFENCLFEGITAKDLMNNELFTIHIVNDKNKFIHKYWIKAAKEYVNTFKKIKFDDEFIPSNIFDYPLFENAFNPNNSLVCYIKAATKIGKNYAIKHTYAQYYKNLGYVILVIVPTNSISKEQSEMITYTDKNGIERKKSKYITFTSETKAQSKARLKKIVNVENKDIPYNVVISNQDTAKETYHFLVNELGKKVVLFFDEGHTLPRYGGFKYKVIDELIELISIAPKSIIQSATPFKLPMFDSIDIELESSTKVDYKPFNLVLMKNELRQIYITNKLLENAKKGIQTIVFDDNVDMLKLIRSEILKDNIYSMICAAKKIDKTDSDKMNLAIEKGRFDWNENEPQNILATQIWEAGVNIYSCKDVEIIYDNKHKLGFDILGKLQSFGRLRNYNEVNVTYTVLSNVVENPPTNEIQQTHLNYNLELEISLLHCETFNKELSLRKKLGKDIKEYHNKTLKDMNIYYDSENGVFKVSKALILSKMYLSVVKSSNPQMSNCASITTFELDERTQTIQSSLEIAKVSQKDIENKNLKRIAILLECYYLETLIYVSTKTNDKYLRKICYHNLEFKNVDIENEFELMYKCKIDYMLMYELEKFLNDLFYFNLRINQNQIESNTIGYLQNVPECRVLNEYERKEQMKFIIDSYLMFNRPLKLDNDRQEQLTDLENTIINTDLCKLQNTKINDTDKSVLEEFTDRINSMQPIKLSVSDLASIKDYLRLIDLFEGVDGAKTAKELLQIANVDKRKKQYKQKYLVDSLKFIFDVTIDDSRKPYKYTINSINDFKKNLE